jgi:large subunit ribosomal protein L18e
MKRTGPTKERSKKVIALLEKTGRKSKNAIWLDIASRLSKPRRQRPTTNLWKIEKLARIFKGKSLVVPGKILGQGQIKEKASVIAFEFSETAKEKIEKAGGKAIQVEKAIEQKIAPKTMIIAK